MKNIKTQKHPKVVVGALVHNKKGEVFLGQSHKWRNKWVVPGGHLEWGEKLEDCIRREVKEETGLEITDINFFEMGECIFSKEFHEQKHMIFFDYMCTAVKDNVKLNHEIQNYIWIDPVAALKKLDLANETKKFIEKYLKSKNKNL
jgi:nucleoside triphosphatase